jgi:hypothetical protein
MARARVVPGLVTAAALAGLVAAWVPAGPVQAQQAEREGIGRATDLDAFMRQVLAKRDENWKKLQQYVLDERESIDLRGPSRTPVWGERREYTWFIREGFFVRSPVKVNGVTIGEADRQKAETEFLERQRRRERRRAESQGQAVEPPSDVESLLRQTREPEFISSAYFLRFRFEEGKYALVGREKLETPVASDVLRIEYYPANLFRGTDRRRNDKGAKEEDRAYDAEFRRLMNKTALVTLWVEPNAHQIVKYTFDNIAWNFLPAQWLVHIDELHASMTMGQPFPEVWLPHALDVQGAFTLAVGQFDLRYGVDYHDYRRADVTTKVMIPKVK